MYDEPEPDVEPYGQGSRQTRTTPTVGPPQAEDTVYGSDDSYAEDRQRERFGGINWGAGFFGWLTAVAMAALLSSIAGVVVTALGVTGDVLPTGGGAATGTLGIAVAATLFGVLMLAYFAGGYVAGRMSRFDGGRQGVGVWIVGLVLIGAVVGLGLVLGRQPGLLGGVNLPALPVQSRALDIRGMVAGGAALLCSLLAAVAGGKTGCRYHRKVDDAAYG